MFDFETFINGPVFSFLFDFGCGAGLMWCIYWIRNRFFRSTPYYVHLFYQLMHSLKKGTLKDREIDSLFKLCEKIQKKHGYLTQDLFLSMAEKDNWLDLDIEVEAFNDSTIPIQVQMKNKNYNKNQIDQKKDKVKDLSITTNATNFKPPKV